MQKPQQLPADYSGHRTSVMQYTHHGLPWVN